MITALAEILLYVTIGPLSRAVHAGTHACQRVSVGQPGELHRANSAETTEIQTRSLFQSSSWTPGYRSELVFSDKKTWIETFSSSVSYLFIYLFCICTERLQSNK